LKPLPRPQHVQRRCQRHLKLRTSQARKGQQFSESAKNLRKAENLGTLEPGNLKVSEYNPLYLWNSGTLKLQNFETLVNLNLIDNLLYKNSLELWNSDTLELGKQSTVLKINQ